MNFQVATSWNELSLSQAQRLSKCMFNYQGADEKRAFQMLLTLFTPKGTTWQRIKFAYLLRNVPLSEIIPYLDFMGEVPTIYSFPTINGLKQPSARMGNVSIKQFSVADKLFYDFMQSKDEKTLRQMVASLYTFEEFEEERLPEVARITDRCKHLWYAVLLSYISCRDYIIKSYPKIFPPEREPNPDEIVPVFKKERSYTPFTEIIKILAFDEPQPLGNYHEAKKTKIYEFMNILTTAMLRQEQQEKYARK
ncbi:hypothetical protein ACQ1PV_09310 [Ornithobacterium rhinotracheale]